MPRKGFDGWEAAKFYQHIDGWLHLPRGFMFTEAARQAFAGAEWDFTDGRSLGHLLPPGTKADVTFGVSPYPPGQSQFISDIVEAAKGNTHGGLCIAPTRAGKTLCSLEAAARLGGTTLVLVNRGVLMKQWVDNVREHVKDGNGKPVKCGIVRAETEHDFERFDYGPEWPFVVGMLHTIARRKLPDDFRRSFRTVIIDECQSAPCDLVYGALRRLHSQYVLGLTATPDRKDGLTQAIRWIIGPAIAELRRDLKAQVHFLQVEWAGAPVRLKSGRKRPPKLVRYGRPSMVEAEKSAAADPNRVGLVVAEVKAAVEAGRRVLILTGLRDTVTMLADRFQKEGLDAGVFMGGASEYEMTKNPIVGTYRYCAEGVDFKPPPTLCVLFGPKTDIRQAVGRVLQPQAPCTPLILDVVDGVRPLMKQAAKRLAFYRAQGFDVLNEVWG